MKKKILALTLALCASLSAAAIPVSAEVETKSAAIANIDMSWPYIKADNKAATKAINSDLRVYMDDFRYDYMYRKFLSGRTWFETAYEDKDIASVVLYDLRNDGKTNTTTVHAINYDLKTGQRIPLEKVCRMTVDDLVKKAATQLLSRWLYSHNAKEKCLPVYPKIMSLTKMAALPFIFKSERWGPP